MTYILDNNIMVKTTLRVLRIAATELNFFKINSIFKVKCSLNAEIFKPKLRSIPSIKKDKMVRGQWFKK